MILVGNQRGGSADLARHLMSAENERVEIHELRGFASESLAGALNESYAISRGTRCRQHLFSLSVNPPADKDVSVEDFEAAIGRVENKLGLNDLPRAIVFHEKNGMDGGLRRHCHAVWSRIDADEMKAVHLSHSKRKLQDVSRDLYIHHGWEMPRGLMDPSARNPLNFTLAQWQQAKRIGKDPKAIKQVFQDAWAISDSRAALIHALAERGYAVAKGDRRGFVAVDAVTDEIFAIPKWVGVKTKAVRERLGEEDTLSSIEQARSRIAQGMLPKIRAFQDELAAKQARQKARMEQHAKTLERKQAEEKARLAREQARRQIYAVQAEKAALRKGLLGLLDRITGRRKQVESENRKQAQNLANHQRTQKDVLITKHANDRHRLQGLQQESRAKAQAQAAQLNQDAQHFEAMRKVQSPDRERRRAEFHAKRKAPEMPQPLKQAHSTAVQPEQQPLTGREAFKEKRKQAASQVPARSRGPRYER